MKKLTDRAVAALKPTSGQSRTDFWDTGAPGLGMRVSGSTKTWVCKYFINGRQRRMTLGRYPAVKLSEARKMTLAVKNDVAKGVDPATARQAKREAQSFGELADIYIERHAKPKKRTWREDRRILDRYCKPWHARKATDIQRHEVADLLQAVAKRNGGIQANRVLATVRKAYNFAIKNGIGDIETNPAHMVDPPARERSRDRVYGDDELRRLWNAFGEGQISGMVFKMCLATGQRLGEVAGMTWDEADLDQRLWTLSAARTKSDRPHLVPLNDIAIELLERLRPLHEIYVFPSPSRPDQAMQNFGKAAGRVKRDTGIDDFRAHDLRRTLSTGITKLGFPRFVADRLLNHADGSIGGVYDRYQYLKEKTDAATAWGRHLRNIVGDDTAVVQLRPA